MTGTPGRPLSAELSEQLLSVAVDILAEEGWGRLNSDRIDYVNNVDVHDHAPDEKTGCATLFIYYLSYQLGYDIQRIIAAQAPTLAGVYRNLTGDAADPFPAFKQMLDAAFPRTAPDGTHRLRGEDAGVQGYPFGAGHHPARPGPS